MYNTIYCLTLKGWPECRQEGPQITRHFLGAQDELSVNSGLLLKGPRVCIPLELLNCTLTDPHVMHQGTDKMQAQAERTVYWPGIDADITMSAGAPFALSKKPLPLHSQCFLEISPMTHGRRSLLNTSPKRVESTY